MMQQYLDTKKKCEGCLLFFRLGDFYEMFFEDALTASKELEITLTGRDCGLEERAPMCGVPYHSAENYINKLVEKGYKVAICEQVEDPKSAKGIVKREIIRIVTPGTLIDTNVLEEGKNNYLMSIYSDAHSYGIAIVDITTGEFRVTEITGSGIQKKLMEEIAKYSPAELICNKDFANAQSLIEEIRNRFHTYINEYNEWSFDYETAYKKLCEHFHVHHLDGLGLKEFSHGISASGALLEYLNDTQKVNLGHVVEITPYYIDEFMRLDISSRRNLELTETLREKSRKGSLLWVLDKTKTAMGARLLRKWLEQPLLDAIQIRKRLDGVEEFKNNAILREELKELLNGIYDLERLMSKVIYGTVNGRDLIALKNSIALLPHIKTLLSECHADYQKEIYDQLDILEDIYQLIDQAIIDEPPISVKEGDIIKAGYHPEVDKLRKAKTEGKQWIAALESEEKEKTGIKNLKIKYNKVFGYFIEITKSNFDSVPDRYIRKQTLANAERYITPELKELEETVLGAEEKVMDLEYKLFLEIREHICGEVERIQKTAKQIAVIDVLQSLGDVADRQNYVKPDITEEDTIHIKNGRHPVVEKMMPMEQFISNDTYLDENENRLAIITGPNMAGKSTYMRQVALIVLMAQIGSFVPAESAEIGIVDRIFTRVGASDDLASGQSTFMVEMSEVANILHNATHKSLLILDEIGRGTSTFDGLSIAWAVIEYISNKNKIGAKTLFATHYHELTELEGKIPGVNNYCIDVVEKGDTIIFLRKIKRGGADHSYGIQVAKLAGLPNEVIDRAKYILSELDEADISKHTKSITAAEPKPKTQNALPTQLDLFSAAQKEFIQDIVNVDVLNMTPMEAMQKLYDLIKKAKTLI
ncbi:DNA mismatch repair protein MutS [Defluviitalea saccharophila]|uniref:DNA mismatch repair protein MutS n=1 Tax=Defluviitalea saccharophila TaxID=879970 RepID=A0ABZ2Y8S6_9FIRM|nr:DNA mismatch repair protein MutS [Candidatus Epulonipiscium sp.]